VLVLWEEAEEPFVKIASWQNGDYQQASESAGALEQIVQPEYEAVAFLTVDFDSHWAVVQHRPLRVANPIINKQLLARFQISSVASAPFSGTICRGRVFFLDRGTWSDDHVLLTEIVASRIAMELDRQILQLQAEQVAVAQERIRLTRDLHDGILQSLTAAALQLKLSSDVPEALQSRIEIVKQLLQSEQRRIRNFVRGVFPKAAAEKDVLLSRDIEQLLSESGRHWECTTSLTVEPDDARVSSTLGIQISFMLAEAVANAVRHGAASKVEVRIAKTDDNLVIDIRDNGHGFDKQPMRYDHEQLAASGKGPVSLRERVSEFGGSLSLASSSAGTELHIRVPLS
jgi:signal transduction histidine kinase